MNQDVERPMINLEQQFDLFPTQGTDIQPQALGQVPRLKTRVTLQIPPDLAPLPVDIHAIPQKAEKLAVLTPFNPQRGYLIDGSDYQSGTRIRKYYLLSRLLGQQIPPLEAPLAVSASLVDFRNFTSDVERMTKLRLALSFPGRTGLGVITYESQSPETAVRAGRLAFDFFYPADRGPLAVLVGGFVLRGNELREGLYIHLPWDLEKPAEWNLARLSQVKGRFYLDTGVPWTFRRSLSFKL